MHQLCLQEAPPVSSQPSWLPAVPQHHPALPWQLPCYWLRVCPHVSLSAISFSGARTTDTVATGSKVCPVQPPDGKGSCWPSWGMSPWRHLLWATVSAVTQHIIPLDLWTCLLLTSLLHSSTTCATCCSDRWEERAPKATYSSLQYLKMSLKYWLFLVHCGDFCFSKMNYSKNWTGHLGQEKKYGTGIKYNYLQCNWAVFYTEGDRSNKMRNNC